LLYICIPVRNEADTIGVLLWRIRKVFQDFDREYELLVHNDASDDHTAETLQPYGEVLPLTILGSERRVGYAAALEELVRTAVNRTKYGRRDAVIIMQGDFTDPPEHLPDLIRRFEGGADIVVAERDGAQDPVNVRRLRRVGDWLLRAVRGRPAVADPFGSYRLYRVSVLRDLLKARGSGALVLGDRWAANADLLMGALPHARRVEPLTVVARYDLRLRESRIRPLADGWQLWRFARGARARHRGAGPPAKSGATT
jgi:glycosyltransferase involved in cell wall biosynthesis